MKIKALAVVILAASSAAQQPNGATAGLTVNGFDHGPGLTGPVNVQVVTGGALVVDVAGGGGQPFALGVGTVAIPGTSFGGFGLIDLAPGFQVVLNGISPTQFLDFFAVADASGRWTLNASVGSAFSGTGVQAAVADPTNPAGATTTAASDVTVGALPLTTVYSEAVLGDDVTLTYFHQALAFPFYGTTYTATHIDTNGYIAFGAITPSQPTATPGNLTAGPPIIAPYWSDMHMSSTVASTFGFTTPVPASVIVSEQDTPGGGHELQIEWRWATEAAGPVVRWDFGARLNDQGCIEMLFGADLLGGWIPPSSNSVAIVGVGPGGGLSTASSIDLISGAGVNAQVASNPFDALFEFFPSPPFPLQEFLVPGATGQFLAFAPLAGPLDTTYQVFQQ